VRTMTTLDTTTTAGTTTLPPRSVWTRLLIMVPVFLAMTTLIGLVTGSVAGSAIASLVVGPVLAVGGVWFYRRMVRLTEHREATELARPGARAGLLRGAAIGGAGFALVVAVTAVFGGYHVLGFGSFGGFLASVGMMCAVAVSEEVLFRGVIFRLVEERGGTRVALVVSAVLFGAVHLVNAGATLTGAVAIAVEAGLMLGAAYVATRSLWLPIGLHFAWNLAEGGIFGTTVSGSDATPTGLLHAAVTGPEVLSGGTFGPEAGLPALLLGLGISVYFLRRAKRSAAAQA
jgi:uncharacterized protein